MIRTSWIALAAALTLCTGCLVEAPDTTEGDTDVVTEVEQGRVAGSRDQSADDAARSLAVIQDGPLSGSPLSGSGHDFDHQGVVDGHGEDTRSDGDDRGGPDPTPWKLGGGEALEGDSGGAIDGGADEIVAGPDPTPWRSDDDDDDDDVSGATEMGPDPTPWRPDDTSDEEEPDPQPWRTTAGSQDGNGNAND